MVLLSFLGNLRHGVAVSRASTFRAVVLLVRLTHIVKLGLTLRVFDELLVVTLCREFAGRVLLMLSQDLVPVTSTGSCSVGRFLSSNLWITAHRLNVCSRPSHIGRRSESITRFVVE